MMNMYLRLEIRNFSHKSNDCLYYLIHKNLLTPRLKPFFLEHVRSFEFVCADREF